MRVNLFACLGSVRGLSGERIELPLHWYLTPSAAYLSYSPYWTDVSWEKASLQTRSLVLSGGLMMINPSCPGGRIYKGLFWVFEFTGLGFYAGVVYFLFL